MSRSAQEAQAFTQDAQATSVPPEVKSPEDVVEATRTSKRIQTVSILGSVKVVNEDTLLVMDKQFLPPNFQEIKKGWTLLHMQSEWWSRQRSFSVCHGEVPRDEKLFALADRAWKHYKSQRSIRNKSLPEPIVLTSIIEPMDAALFEKEVIITHHSSA
jgi:hypothetical protein